MDANVLYDVGKVLVSPLVIGMIVGVGYHVTRWRDSRAAKAINRRTINSGHSNDLAIYELLTDVRSEFRSMRAYLTKFHNGDHFVDGSEILRKTRTHEVVRSGISYQTDDFKGTLVCSIPEEMELILEPGPGFQTVASMQDSKFKWLCVNGGTRAIARAAIRKNGEVVAFLGVDFDIDVVPQGIDRLTEYAGRLETLM